LSFLKWLQRTTAKAVIDTTAAKTSRNRETIKAKKKKKKNDITGPTALTQRSAASEKDSHSRKRNKKPKLKLGLGKESQRVPGSTKKLQKVKQYRE